MNRDCRRRTRAVAAFALICASVPTFLAAEPARPTIAVVLSGGGSRGFAHIGALKVIEELGVPIDLVVGTSMGAIVGGLYSAGYSPSAIETLTRELDWQWLISDAQPRSAQSPAKRAEEGALFGSIAVNSDGNIISGGILSGQRVNSLLQCLALPVSLDPDFDALRPRFSAVAVDLVSATEYHFRSGSLATAMRASMSTPGIFDPVPAGRALFVDGGVLNDLLVDVAKQLGADIVIAVDVTSPLRPDDKLSDPVTILRRTLNTTMLRDTRRNREDATILITPDLGRSASTDFSIAEFAIARGEDAAWAAGASLATLAPERERVTQANRVRRPTTLDYNRVKVSGARAAAVNILIRELRLEPIAGSALYRPLMGTVTPVDLYELGQSLESSGQYGRVDFSLHRSTDGRQLLDVHLSPRTREPFSIGIGAGLSFASTQARLETFGHTALIFGFGPSSTLNLGAAAGMRNAVETRFVQQIRGSFYISPAAFYEWQSADALQPEQSGASVAIGYRPDATLDLSAGYRVHALRAGAVDGGIEGRVIWDTRDRTFAPQNGGRLALMYQIMAQALGGQRNIQRVSVDASFSVTYADRHTLSVRIDSGSLLESMLSPTFAVPADLLFPIGQTTVPGYADGLVVTPNYAVGTLAYRFRIVGTPRSVPVFFPAGIYATIHGTYGTVWNDLASFDPLGNPLLGAGAGFLVTSPVGALRLELRSSNQTPLSLFLSVGTDLPPR